ncbi:type VII secretion system-associated protein [Actinoplanes sp. TBRC 11911]|uniref:type VII secretion system-associated protein n=1 Tax=Actinoplanes sp. TBRC 11911 TaxID=2729386 RepID=UPI00145FCBAD|nr:type VII secretion system-associated protein [Actinoplanes sp. TBRC 11911]NMO56928.1 type VII secretion system-associated protein [Actinoplanes sp. TBRC 11911]
MDGILLTDPEWDEPDERAVIGIWPLREDGTTGPFRPNPGYVPRFENSPTDPIDAAVRLAMHGEVEIEQLRELLADSEFWLAFNGDGRPLLVRSPDEVLCVVVATSAVHRDRLFAPDWRTVELFELRAVLPDDADVLVNPEGAAWVRLSGGLIR